VNTNFEAIYAALSRLLVDAGHANVTADSSVGSQTLTGIADTAPLVPGLAVTNPGLPIGTVVLSTGSGTALLSQAATLDATGGTFRAGYLGDDYLRTRLLRHWTDVPGSEQPCMFVAQGDELSEKRPGQPAKWTLFPTVYVYVQAPDDRTPPGPALNALLGTIRDALGPDRSGPGRVQNRQTLGGLVFDTWIEGKIETDEGYLGQQAVAKVPIRIIQNGP
jgi:hypothetical protein